MMTENDKLKLKALTETHEDFRNLVDKLKEEQQFTVSQISHEIRNPVTLINSSLQLIESQHPEVRDFAFWPQVMEDMLFLRNLLNELSTFNNGEYLHVSPLATEDWLKSIVISIQAHVASSTKTFTYNIEKSLPSIQADETKLHQAINNLLRNALEAVSENGCVSFQAYHEAGNLVLSVKDTGNGIPAEYMDTLFTPFITHKKNGTGLGLCISKRIVEAHHGTLQVDTKLGEGSLFTIRLPMSA